LVSWFKLHWGLRKSEWDRENPSKASLNSVALMTEIIISENYIDRFETPWFLVTLFRKWWSRVLSPGRFQVIGPVIPCYRFH
jgi:hypothetical protein